MCPRLRELALSYRGIEEVHGVAVKEEQRDDDGRGHDEAPEDVLGSRSLKIVLVLKSLNQ